MVPVAGVLFHYWKIYFFSHRIQFWFKLYNWLSQYLYASYVSLSVRKFILTRLTPDSSQTTRIFHPTTGISRTSHPRVGGKPNSEINRQSLHVKHDPSLFSLNVAVVQELSRFSPNRRVRFAFYWIRRRKKIAPLADIRPISTSRRTGTIRLR